MKERVSPGSSSILAGEIMRPNPEVVHIDQSIVEAAGRMRRCKTGLLFAIDGDELVGVLSDRDIVTRGLAEGRDVEDVSVMDVMTRHVIAVPADSPVEKVVATMMRDRVRRLAVVNDDGELVGAISLSDVALSNTGGSLGEMALRVVSRASFENKRPRTATPTGGRAADMQPRRTYSVQPRLKHRAH